MTSKLALREQLRRAGVKFLQSFRRPQERALFPLQWHLGVFKGEFQEERLEKEQIMGYGDSANWDGDVPAAKSGYSDSINWAGKVTWDDSSFASILAFIIAIMLGLFG